jgi:hypothetical protein
MALKDLTVAKSEVTEKQVEDIVADYVRYDPGVKGIMFLPAAASLSNKSKTLVYLVALQGWPFITDESIPTEATPAQIEDAVHIQGGTLRPILKSLKDSHLISARGRAYSVRSAALTNVKAEITGSGKTQTHFRPKSKVESADSQIKYGGTSTGTGTLRKRPKQGESKAETFEKMVLVGFFGKPRTASEVREQFHRYGQIVPLSSVPQYLLKAIRDKKLDRDKKDVNGKTVWVYEAPQI